MVSGSGNRTTGERSVTRGAKTNLHPGQKFGDRVVLGAAAPLHRLQRVYVRCKCGSVDIVISSRLANGTSPRCAPCSRTHAAIERARPFVGTFVGAREIVGIKSGGRKSRGIYFKVRCQCGFESDVRKGDLASGGRTMCVTCMGRKRSQDYALMEATNV